MRRDFLNRVRLILEAGLVAGAAAFVLVYVGVALSRIAYPFELEWMEGGMVDHVRRLLSGQPIYAKPSLAFVSFLYPPLYYAVAAAFAKVFGLGFFPLRLLSFLSSLGAIGLIVLLVRRETASWVPAAVAGGLFAGSFRLCGGWFDLARLDSFYLMTLLGGIVALRLARTGPRALAAGALVAAAFFTKQSAIVVFVPLAAYAVLDHRRRAAWFVGGAVLVGGAGVALLDRWSDGWFLYYCFRLPSRHPRVAGSLLGFWTDDVAPAFVLAAGGAVAFAVFRLGRGEPRERFFLPLAAAGLVGSSWSVRTLVGAETNNLMPALAAFALLAALGFDALRRRAEDGASTRGVIACFAAAVLLSVQFAALAYDPRRQLPSPSDLAAGERAVARISAIQGDVFVPHHGYLALRAGKAGFAHTLAMDNVFLDDDGPLREQLARELLGAMRARRFGAVVLESDGRYREAILQGYAPREPIFPDPGVFWPVTGGRLRPEFLCLPR